jgi:hypothetical protein
MTATELPEPLAALAATLEAQGFAVDEQPPNRESFGDQLITFEDERLRVRVTRDRGQWTIELGHPSWENVYDPDVWRAALEGTDPTEPSTLEEQAAYVAGALDRLRDAAGDPALRERLDEIAIARADLWFG